MTMYLVGSFLAVGMLIGDGLFSDVIEGIKDAYNGVFDKIRIIFFSLFLIAVAFLFSWLFVGYIYMMNKRDQ